MGKKGKKKRRGRERWSEKESETERRSGGGGDSGPKPLNLEEKKQYVCINPVTLHQGPLKGNKC